VPVVLYRSGELAHRLSGAGPLAIAGDSPQVADALPGPAGRRSWHRADRPKWSGWWARFLTL